MDVNQVIIYLCNDFSITIKVFRGQTPKHC